MGLVYLLDTNIVSEFAIPFGNEKVLSKIEMQASFSAICAPVWFELLKGVDMLPHGKRKDLVFDAIENFVHSNFSVLSYDESAASLNSHIAAKMIAAGTPTPVIDTQIASIAMSNKLILVTRNIKDYEPIREHFSLCVENWFE